MKKIIIVNGSPRRKGNTVFLIGKMKEKLKETLGEELQIIQYDCNKLNIRPCQHCNACIKEIDTYCIQKDDMQAFFPEILTADAIIFASPIYWFTVTAQLKTFLDRLYAFHYKGGFALQNKIMAGIFVYGDSSVEGSGVKNAIASFKQAFSYSKTKYGKFAYGTAGDIGDAAKNLQLLTDIAQMATEILELI